MPTSKIISPRIVVIVGPTATGKSDLAVRLARRFKGEIISADSRQVYRGLDIGSGKITRREMQGIPHHLLDVTDPRRTYTVVKYAKQARNVLEDILKRGKTPIVVGGSGFYIQALIDGIILPEVPPNPKLRARLASLSAPRLMKMLKARDPVRASSIDPKNTRRIIRALEIVSALGAVPPVRESPLPYETIFIGLDISPRDLRARIKKRLTKRLKQGMLNEAKKLHTKGLPWKRMEELGLEYRYLAYHLQKKMTLEEMTEKLETEIWHYAKRQLTWFRRDKRIHWINAPYSQNAKKLL